MTDGFNDMASLFVRYIRSVGQVMFHPVSTTPMASRELGGVVDSNLIVYGTQNLRVGKSILFLKKEKKKRRTCYSYGVHCLVDAGIFPIQISAMPQASIYAIAEKVQDLLMFPSGLLTTHLGG